MGRKLSSARIKLAKFVVLVSFLFLFFLKETHFFSFRRFVTQPFISHVSAISILLVLNLQSDGWRNSDTLYIGPPLKFAKVKIMLQLPINKHADPKHKPCATPECPRFKVSSKYVHSIGTSLLHKTCLIDNGTKAKLFKALTNGIYTQLVVLAKM